jgi:hypothetical protein
MAVMQQREMDRTYFVLVDEHGLLHSLQRHDLSALSVTTQEHLKRPPNTHKRRRRETR